MKKLYSKRNGIIRKRDNRIKAIDLAVESIKAGNGDERYWGWKILDNARELTEIRSELKEVNKIIYKEEKND